MSFIYRFHTKEWEIFYEIPEKDDTKIEWILDHHRNEANASLESKDNFLIELEKKYAIIEKQKAEVVKPNIDWWY